MISASLAQAAAYPALWLRRQLDKHKVVCVVPTKSLDNHAFNGKYSLPAYRVLAEDNVRGRAYERAIKAMVKGKSVLDLGTGGLAHLARMCRAAGARMVYGIEQNERFRDSIAASIAKDADGCPIEPVYGFSTDVELPEKVDVLVQQVVGTIGSNEGMARTVADAKKRLVKPDGQYIPRRVATYVAPTSPLAMRAGHRIVNRLVGGTDTILPRTTYEVLNFPMENVLSPGQTMEDFVFADDFPLVFDRRCEFHMAADGVLDGLVFYVEIEADENNVVSARDANIAWPTPYVKLFETPVGVSKGDVMTVDFHVDLSTTLPRYALVATVGEHRVEHSWAGAGK